MRMIDPQTLRDAQRDAIATALAAHRGDAQGMRALWSGSASREALLHALARLSSTLIVAVSEREGRAYDPEEVLQDLLDQLPIIQEEPR